MQPATLDYLRTVAAELANCGHGAKEPVLARAQAMLGCSRAALYTRLAKVGYTPDRKRRADAGEVSLSRDEAEKIAALVKSATRQTGKRILSVADAVDVLRVNGQIAAQRIDEATGEVFELSTTSVLRALRVYGLHTEQLTTRRPHVQLASRHPNHVWEMDFSVCVLFYLRADDGLRVMDEREFNRNKPANVARVEKDRVQRIVIVDHTTHTMWLSYAYGAESAALAIDALIRAMLPRADYPPHGVCLVLYTDQGSAFKGVFENFVRRLMIDHIRHESSAVKDDAARATGSVEVANNIIESSFEGKLGIGYRATSIEMLNALADKWSRWYCATQKHSRHGMTRVNAWLKITEQQLRLAPDEAVLRSLATTHPESRTVTGNLRIPFARKGEGSREYSLRDIPGLESIRVGDKVNVVLNPYHPEGIILVTPSADGKSEVHTPLMPIPKDSWGYAEGSPIIGESFAALPESDTERANKRLEQIAYGVETQDAVRDAKKQRAVAFEGIDPHKPHEAVPDVDYLPKKGTPLEAASPVYVAPVVMLTLVEAARLLRDRMQGEWTADHYHALSRLYPDGVAESELDQAHDRITGRTRLRVVAGGAS